MWITSFICGTWHIRMWDMTYSYMGHDSIIWWTWLIHMWDVTEAYVRHDIFIWSSHVPYMNMSCLTYECVTSHIWTMLSTYEWVMSHVERVMSHILIKTRPTYERVVSHIWSSHVPHRNQTGHVYKSFVSHICINYVSHIESCPSHVPQNNKSWVYGRIISLIWMSHVPYVHQLYFTYICAAYSRVISSTT